MSRLVALSAWANQLAEALVILFAAFFTGLIVISVFSRYVLDVSLVSGVELTRIAFLWSIFLAASCVVARNGHVRITIAVAWLPAVAKRALLRFTFLCISAFGGAMLSYGAALTVRMTDTFLPTMQISQAWLYAALPVSGALIVLHALAHLCDAPRIEVVYGGPAE